MSITYDPDQGLTIGAAAPCYQIARHEAVRSHYPCLVDSASLIGGIAIQGRASLGGNLCNASPAADGIPSLIVLAAEAVIAGPGGRRTLPVEDFCTGPGTNALAPGEFPGVVTAAPAAPRQRRCVPALHPPRGDGHRGGQRRLTTPFRRRSRPVGPESPSARSRRHRCSLPTPRRRWSATPCLMSPSPPPLPPPAPMLAPSRICAAPSNSASIWPRCSRSAVSAQPPIGHGASDMTDPIVIGATINGEATQFLASERDSLLEALRDRVGLIGTKEGCNNGNCGACTVILDGRIVCSCLVMAPEVAGSTITTIEGSRHRRCPAPHSAGLPPGRRAPVWDLHAGLHRGGQGPARPELRAHGGRRAPLAGRQPLPLHRLRQDRPGGSCMPPRT